MQNPKTNRRQTGKASALEAEKNGKGNEGIFCARPSNWPVMPSLREKLTAHARRLSARSERREAFSTNPRYDAPFTSSHYGIDQPFKKDVLRGKMLASIWRRH